MKNKVLTCQLQQLENLLTFCISCRPFSIELGLIPSISGKLILAPRSTKMCITSSDSILPRICIFSICFLCKYTSIEHFYILFLLSRFNRLLNQIILHILCKHDLHNTTTLRKHKIVTFLKSDHLRSSEGVSVP